MDLWRLSGARAITSRVLCVEDGDRIRIRIRLIYEVHFQFEMCEPIGGNQTSLPICDAILLQCLHIHSLTKTFAAATFN